MEATVEVIGSIFVLLSFGVFLWAVVGLINPAWARLPHRKISVAIWALSAVLAVTGGSLVPSDNSTGATAAERPVIVPEPGLAPEKIIDHGAEGRCGPTTQDVVDLRAERREIANADLSGVWSLGQGEGYAYFYPDKSLLWLGPNCSVKGVGTWEYEYGTLGVYTNGRLAFSTAVIGFDKGRKLTLDTTREWLFLGGDLDAEC